MSAVYYNEIDPFAAAWLRNLMADGHIPEGEVDERSIKDVKPDDITAFDQCHFFAGIGGWSVALDLAGWGERPVWTGSCPCQPFSSAGKARGAGDERHLWPAFHALIAECRPPTIFGEQVESPLGRTWLAAVRLDLEDLGYACGAADLCAAGAGAPHIRQRLYWMADASSLGCDGRGASEADEGKIQPQRRGNGGGWLGDANSEGWSARIRSTEAPRQRHSTDPTSSARDGLVHTLKPRLEGYAGHGDRGRESGRVDQKAAGSVAASSTVGRLADAERHGTRDKRRSRLSRSSSDETELHESRSDGTSSNRDPWATVELVALTDGTVRFAEPGSFPLAHGVPERVGRLRGYGNAIVPQVAATFIRAFMEAA